MPTQKIDPKVIFASDAPAIDKPPVFSDKTKGWDVSRANDGRPTIKEMNKVQQDTDLKILWLNENSVTPYDSSIDYPDGAVAIKDGSFKQLSSGAWVEFLDDFADKDAVKRGIANRYDSSLTYNSGERVVLTNGDVVRSTIDGNTNDPNVDMTGWVNINLVKYLEDFGGGINIANNSAAITSANSAKSVIYAKGTYKVSSNTTITHNMDIIDSKIQPAAGVVVTVDDTVVIDANTEWVDTSLGGSFDFIAGAFERRVSKISTSPTSEYNINQGYPGNQISNQAPGVFVNGGTRSFPHKIGDNSGLSVIGGAYDNTIEANAIATTIAGGAHHIVKTGATHSAILGGSYHTTFGNYSTLGGGTQNKVGSNYSTVGGGQNNIAGDETLASLDDSRSAVVAGGASNSAKGKWSAIGGGSTNTIPNTAESAAILGGRNNSASGIRSAVLGGNNNTASGQASVCLGGNANSATTTTAAAGGNGSIASGISSFAYGDYCNANGLQSVATGARCNAYLAGMKAHANGWFTVAGDAQISDLVARITTTDATAKRLDLNGGASAAIVIPNNKTWMFVISIVARNTAASEHAAYEIKGCIKRDAAANTTAFIGTPTVTVIAESVAGWDATVSANTTTGALDINVTGEATKTIRWVARIQLTEVGI